MKKFLAVAKTLRQVLKYAGLILVVFDIIGYAIGKIEEYAVKKDPKLKREVEQNAAAHPVDVKQVVNEIQEAAQ